MTVENMTSSNGNKIPNQFLLKQVPAGTYKDNDGKDLLAGIAFQSYSTIIGYREYATGKMFLDRDKWDYSVTTGKYRNQFTGLDKKATLKAIESGKIVLINLNVYPANRPENEEIK